VSRNDRSTKGAEPVALTPLVGLSGWKPTDEPDPPVVPYSTVPYFSVDRSTSKGAPDYAGLFYPPEQRDLGLRRRLRTVVQRIRDAFRGLIAGWRCG